MLRFGGPAPLPAAAGVDGAFFQKRFHGGTAHFPVQRRFVENFFQSPYPETVDAGRFGKLYVKAPQGAGLLSLFYWGNYPKYDEFKTRSAFENAPLLDFGKKTVISEELASSDAGFVQLF